MLYGGEIWMTSKHMIKVPISSVGLEIMSLTLHVFIRDENWNVIFFSSSEPNQQFDQTNGVQL